MSADIIIRASSFEATIEPTFKIDEFDCECTRTKSEFATDGVCQRLCSNLKHGIGPRNIFESMCHPLGCREEHIQINKSFPGCKNAKAKKWTGHQAIHNQLCISLCYELIDDYSKPPRWKLEEIQHCNSMETDNLIECFETYHKYRDIISCTLITL